MPPKRYVLGALLRRSLTFRLALRIGREESAAVVELPHCVIAFCIDLIALS